MTGDVANAFLTAPCHQKVSSRTGSEFKDKEGSIVKIKRALYIYGLATAARAYHEIFC